MDIPSLPNLLGFLSLIAYVLTLLPSILRVVFPAKITKTISKQLLQYRREIGVLAFLLGLAHGYLITQRRHFNWLNLSTFILSFEGMTTLLIFTLLAITSNSYATKKLRKNWKRLHNLTYLAMFLLTWHVITKMMGHWSWVTPWGAIVLLTITLLFLVRKWIEPAPQTPIAHPLSVLVMSYLFL